MKDELQSYMDRPKRYENIDGTGEIYMGLMILGFALLGYVFYLAFWVPLYAFWI